MTPAQLKTEIQTGPLAAALAPLVAAGNDVGVAALLNARTLRGLVPILEMARYCAKGSPVASKPLWKRPSAPAA